MELGPRTLPMAGYVISSDLAKVKPASLGDTPTLPIQEGCPQWGFAPLEPLQLCGNPTQELGDGAVGLLRFLHEGVVGAAVHQHHL